MSSQGAIADLLTRILGHNPRPGAGLPDYGLGRAVEVPAPDPTTRSPVRVQALQSSLAADLGNEIATLLLDFDRGSPVAGRGLVQRLRARVTWGTGGVTQTALMDWSCMVALPARNLIVETAYGGAPFGIGQSALFATIGDGDHDVPLAVSGSLPTDLVARATVAWGPSAAGFSRFPSATLSYPWVLPGETVWVPPFSSALTVTVTNPTSNAGVLNVRTGFASAIVQQVINPLNAGGIFELQLGALSRNGSPDHQGDVGAFVENATPDPQCLIFKVDI